MGCGNCGKEKKPKEKKKRNQIAIVQESFDKIFEGRVLSLDEFAEWCKRDLTLNKECDTLRGMILPGEYDYTIQEQGEGFVLIPLKKEIEDGEDNEEGCKEICDR